MVVLRMHPESALLDLLSGIQKITGCGNNCPDLKLYQCYVLGPNFEAVKLDGNGIRTSRQPIRVLSVS